ncbi:hypothetical protein DICVIV_09006 [Dictyocaulus viviparus]|uniref:Globin n=1 Tax=Dictyocaulus viviparus TaxID=29172 RepID=A0A0D8XMD7_DICVI|nr:hypothetical protein DICVIV_09006 [Dictyocaulus viviparus]
MITGARSAMRYRRNNVISKTKPKKRQTSHGNTTKIGDSSSPSASTTSLQSTNSSSLLTVPVARKRSGSVPAFKLITLASVWNLSKEHVRGLRMTWIRLCEPPRSNCKGIVNLVERVWEKLENKDATVRNIFYNTAFVETMNDRCERRKSKRSIATLRDHTHFFVSLISQVIQNLDVDPENILDHIDSIGRSHAYLYQYGFRSSYWEKIGEYFVDIVVIQNCVRGFPDACRAWTILVAALVDRLRAAPRRGSYSVLLKTSRSSINDEDRLCAAPCRGSYSVLLATSRSSINDDERHENSTGSRRESDVLRTSQSSLHEYSETQICSFSKKADFDQQRCRGSLSSLLDMNMTSLGKALPQT